MYQTISCQIYNSTISAIIDYSMTLATVVYSQQASVILVPQSQSSEIHPSFPTATHLSFLPLPHTRVKQNCLLLRMRVTELRLLASSRRRAALKVK